MLFSSKTGLGFQVNQHTEPTFGDSSLQARLIFYFIQDAAVLKYMFFKNRKFLWVNVCNFFTCLYIND